MWHIGERIWRFCDTSEKESSKGHSRDEGGADRTGAAGRSNGAEGRSNGGEIGWQGSLPWFLVTAFSCCRTYHHVSSAFVTEVYISPMGEVRGSADNPKLGRSILGSVSALSTPTKLQKASFFLRTRLKATPFFKRFKVRSRKKGKDQHSRQGIFGWSFHGQTCDDAWSFRSASLNTSRRKKKRKRNVLRIIIFWNSGIRFYFEIRNCVLVSNNICSIVANNIK